MKNLIYLIICFSIIACSNSVSTDFVGKWQSPNSKQSEITTITKNGDNYLISIDDNKTFIGTLENEILTINIKGRTINAVLDQDGYLIINGKKLVRVE